MISIIKALLQTSSGSFAELILRMISSKILAVIIGVEGVGFYSLLRQVRDTMLRIASLNGGQAIVQGVASKDAEDQSTYLGTVVILLALSSLLVIGVLFAFAPTITQRVFVDNEYQTVLMVRLIAIPVILDVINGYLISVLNGYRFIGVLVISRVTEVLFLALATYPLGRLIQAGYLQGYIGLMGITSLVGLVLPLVHLGRKGLLWNLKFKLNFNSARHFLTFSGSSLFAGFYTTGILLAIRAEIVAFAGLSGAGWFDVAWMLSMVYMSVITSSFGMYYMPTLSQTKDLQERVVLMRRVLRLVVSLMIPLIVVIVVLKPLFINLFYSQEFLPALVFIRWMLLADLLKVTSWVFGMTLPAFADMKVFFWKESLLFTAFYLGTVISTRWFNTLEGVGVTYLLVYVANLFYLFYYVYKKHNFRPTRHTIFHWLLGFTLISGASLHTWYMQEINWISVLLWIGIAIVFLALTLTKNERQGLLRLVLNPSTLVE